MTNTRVKSLLTAALLVPAAIVFLSGAGNALAARAEPPLHLMLMFQDQEPGIAPYATRVIITKRYMRMDDGKGSRDFMLFDRRKNTVYSVSYDNRSILVVHGKPVTRKSPIPLTIDVRKTEHPNAPKVGGEKPVQYNLRVNGKDCSTVMSVPGLLPDAVAALSEFRRALAGQHAENLSKTPVDMLNPCFLAYHVFEPTRELRYGFPVRQWDVDGNKRALVDFNAKFKVDPALFKLPSGFSFEEMGPAGVTTAPKA